MWNDIVFIIVLEGVHFTDVIKKNGLSLLILETGNRSGHRKSCGYNTPDIIKRTRKMSKIDRNNVFSRLKFDTERA